MSWDTHLSGDERRELASRIATETTDPRPMLRYYAAGLGWHIFPTLRESKRPLVHWPTDATTDLPTIHNWYVKWRGCGWAVNVGMSQLWVVDCDTPEGYLEWQAHCAQHNDHHQSAIAMTGGGGRHVYYHDPYAQGVQSVRRFGDHFDTRAAGGYVVVPPTLHASGQRYTWITPPRKIQRIPLWVTEEWKPMSKRPPFTGLWTCGRGEGLVEKLLRASPTDREGCLRRAALHVGRLAAKDELANAVLGDLANAAITRGIPHDEAYNIAHAAFKSTAELHP